MNFYFFKLNRLIYFIDVSYRYSDNDPGQLDTSFMNNGAVFLAYAKKMTEKKLATQTQKCMNINQYF